MLLSKSLPWGADIILKIREWNGQGSQGLNPAVSGMDRKQEAWVRIRQMPHRENGLIYQIGWHLDVFSSWKQVLVTLIKKNWK